MTCKFANYNKYGVNCTHVTAVNEYSKTRDKTVNPLCPFFLGNNPCNKAMAPIICKFYKEKMKTVNLDIPLNELEIIVHTLGKINTDYGVFAKYLDILKGLQNED